MESATSIMVLRTVIHYSSDVQSSQNVQVFKDLKERQLNIIISYCCLAFVTLLSHGCFQVN